jgi:hypothetical protein
MGAPSDSYADAPMAPAGRSVVSATSVLSDLAFDFDFLSVSVALW